MALLTNIWVRYFDRTYQQIKDRNMTELAALTPEITDHTETNPWVKMLSIFSGIAEMLGLYVDSAAREAHLMSAQLYWTGIKIAKSYDYRVHASLSASVDVTFIMNNPTTALVTIPIGTKVTTEEGIVFLTTAAAVINIGEEFVTVPASQYEDITGTALGMSTGLADQVILMPVDMADSSAQVYVGADVWTPQFTLGYSVGSDKDYVQSVNESKRPYLQFGDDVNGAIPSGGAAITTNYKRTQGAAGNVEAYDIDTIDSLITLPSSDFEIRVENRSKASGGAGVETLAQLKSRIPKSLRTLRRAVTPKDFKEVAEMYPAVDKAGVIFDCGKNVYIYIAPVGGGIASSMLLADVFTWMDDKKVITTKLDVQSAGEVHVILVIDLRVKAGYSRTATAALVKTNLVNFGSAANQEIQGEMKLSDVYETIEETDGVANSDIITMKTLPYARQLAPTTHVLNWTRDLKVGSTAPIRWSIAMTSPTAFDLVRDNIFVGNFNILTLIGIFPELDFTITAGTYALNDNWEFWTYPYYGNIALSEPSIPVIGILDITINTTGGV